MAVLIRSVVYFIFFFSDLFLRDVLNLLVDFYYGQNHDVKIGKKFVLKVWHSSDIWER
jgi:hypothetical protein